MYELGKREKSKRKRKIILRIFVVLILVAAAALFIFVKYGLKPHTTIKQSPAKITKITFTQDKTKVFNEVNFSFSLPIDWEATSHDVTPFNVYRFHGNGKLSKNRQLDVYEDSIPFNYAVNRVLDVEANYNHVTLRGSVSDNCSDFTKGSKTSTTGTKAKWQGIDFLCDLTNYERNVVGTSSPDGVNLIRLQGPTTGQHQYLFIYTENSFNVDYSTLYTAIQSFTLK